MRHDLCGAVALVTGASRGLGAAVGLRLSQAGARVCLLARDEERLREVAGEIQSTGGEAMALPLDARDESMVFDAVSRIGSHWGDVALLVNAMGGKLEGAAGDASVDDLERMWAVNCIAPMTVVRAVLPGMRRAGRGHVVNVSSVLGLRATPLRGAYSASKAGLVAMTEALRIELRREGIDVSLVCPGRLKNAGEVNAGRFSMSCERAAEVIVRVVRRPRRRVILTTSGRILAMMNALAPGLVDRILVRVRSNSHAGPPE